MESSDSESESDRAVSTVTSRLEIDNTSGLHSTVSRFSKNKRIIG